MWNIKTVDTAETTIVVDNMIGGAKDEAGQITFPTDWVGERGNPRYLWAGHGLSVLVRATVDQVTKTVLYDTGPSDELIAHNFASLDLDTSTIDEIVMSHGHWDHFGGLRWILEQTGSRHIPVHVHPRMFHSRSVARRADVEKRRLLPDILSEQEIQNLGGELIFSRDPELLQEDMFLVSGEVPRNTPYELGYSGHEILIDGKWEDDQQIIDDRCLILNVRDRGLVIISGCSHAGIVNMTRHAIRLTGEKRIAAVVGGLHLSGASSDKIEATIQDLSRLDPEILLVGHCTGWRALKAFADAVPKRLFPSAVGTRLSIRSDKST
ncbi:MAG: MBL fold metallo-hydrolase [Candidatus Thorarchaeota archaeon]|nr:MBL fold metallo-hydrolase [Candidatus Thorarchaeota archaeon]